MTTADETTGENTLRDLLYDAAEAPGPVTADEVHVRQLEAVCRYVDRLHDLVRWFDLPFGDNVPQWHFSDQYGNQLTAARELAETYRGVIGDKAGGG
jgi:hypothetical protein